MLVHELLERSAARYADRPAVIQGPVCWSYAELEWRAGCVASALAEEGIARGDRVALLLDNSPLYVAAYYGILKAGGVAVPLFTSVTPRELAAVLGTCGAAAILASPPCRRVVEEVAPRLPSTRVVFQSGGELPRLRRDQRAVRLEMAVESSDPAGRRRRVIDVDVASVIFTSGSTGRPKGVTLSHLNLASNTRSIVEYLRLTAADRVLAVLPFPYVYGKSVLNTHVSAGASVVIENRFVFPALVVAALQDRAVTGFSGVPSTFAALLEKTRFAALDWSHLRYVTQAGGAMAPALTRRLMDALPGTDIYVMYGATEAAARLSYLAPEDLPRKLGSIGKAIPNVELRVLREDGTPAAPGEVGEIVARGSNIMLGYWNDAGGTQAVLGPEGYHTGDLGYCDDEGYFFVVGRKKELIKTSGFRVSPQEVEEVLAEREGVLEAAVVGVEDPELGERIRAYVVLRKDHRDTEERLRAYCRERLAGYKVPQEVVFTRDLPRTAAGKVDKQALRGAAAPGATGPEGAAPNPERAVATGARRGAP